jgi:hypothetical protein
VKAKWLCLLLLLGMVVIGAPAAVNAAPALAKRRPPTVGVIRWDAWFTVPPNSYEGFLAPPQWRYRLPFYARIVSSSSVQVRGDSQAVMDQEIALAHAAGIDYWAFDYSTSAWMDENPGWSDFNYGLHLYLSSARKKDLNFALVLFGNGDLLGRKEDWTTKTVPRLVRLLREPTFQNVNGNRPLIYIFNPRTLIQHFGSKQNARSALAFLRNAARKAGEGNPYLVGMVWSPGRDAPLVRDLGLNALSGYSAPGLTGGFRELSYSRLAQANRSFWNQAQKTGMNVVPIVNTGWDARPRMVDPTLAELYNRTPYYTRATPAQIANHLSSAVRWVAEHSKAAQANTILIYAWNEFDEGGWLTPTLAEGKARLQAISRVLK